MIDCHAVLSQDLFQIAIGHAVSDIEKDRMKNDFFRLLNTFERNHFDQKPKVLS